MLPKLSLISLSSGVAVSSTLPLALDLEMRASVRARADDALHMAEASIGEPSMATTRSPGLKPASSAALPGLTMSTCAAVIGSPKNVKTAVKMTIASRKLAIGPAATTAARGANRLGWKLRLRSSSRHACEAFADRRLATFSSSMKLT